jgi:hypothetical protein
MAYKQMIETDGKSIVHKVDDSDIGSEVNRLQETRYMPWWAHTPENSKIVTILDVQ